MQRVAAQCGSVGSKLHECLQTEALPPADFVVATKRPAAAM